MSVFVSGLIIGLSLIVAIGPQNALIIKQGIKREHVVPILIVCLLSDVILILGGTLGVGVLVESAPMFLSVLKWFGAAYLAYFAFTCFRDAAAPSETGIVAEESPRSHSLEGGDVLVKTAPTRTRKRTSWHRPVLTALAFTWLNPVAYIDALVMLGGIANQHGEVLRWNFAAGALVSSAIWFPTIGFLSVKGASILQRPAIWRIINVAIGCLMIFMTIKLVLH
ncbi:Arginine exporter protein ArgO [Corynebacterium kalinowskii]|uniref:Arginine exporter protein ArgO n=1 Tax=Corynebacterium kalinowskii TaxID=2675216 RepID=A0A6B8VCH4_9CORY|nr:LysE/ArgO family amino acid transporter [Corynebacterium kalinowskii]QGU01833.1 Arginine exporter protein ArgO [Corynebacterium kalinowskii]